VAGYNGRAFGVILGLALWGTARAVVKLSAAIATAIAFEAIGDVKKRPNVFELVWALIATAPTPAVSKLAAFVVRNFIAPRTKAIHLPIRRRANIIKAVCFK
jgi:hypothetical protein